MSFFKELEFKNFLSRFEDTSAPAEAQKSFSTVTELDKAEEIFAKSKKNRSWDFIF